MLKLKLKAEQWDFLGDSGVKSPPANARDMGLIPALGTSHLLQSN